MSSNPSDFARQVLEAFAAAGHATDEEIGDAGGPSTTTLAKYRKVAAGDMTMSEPRGDVLRRIDQAANWRSGSARALWRGGEAPQPPRPTLAEVIGSTAPRPPGRAVRVDSMDGYVQWLGERLTEVEERLDMLTQQLAETVGGGDGDGDSAPTRTYPSLIQDAARKDD